MRVEKNSYVFFLQINNKGIVNKFFFNKKIILFYFFFNYRIQYFLNNFKNKYSKNLMYNK